MTLEEFKEYVKTVTREEFLKNVFTGPMNLCPEEYGLKGVCIKGVDHCKDCWDAALLDIQFKDGIYDFEKEIAEFMKSQPIIISKRNDVDSVVNHPNHYTHGKIETIDKIEDVLGLEGFQAYCVGNAIKYLDRYKLKNGFEDIKKAKRYLEFYIEKTEGRNVKDIFNYSCILLNFL